MAPKSSTNPYAPPKVKVGAYLDRNAHTAIVVKVANGKVAYLTMETGKIELEVRGAEHFLRKFVRYLSGYPPERAAAKYRDSGLFMSDEAARVLFAIVGR